MVSKSFFLCYQIHDTSFTEFLFTWREKRQDIVPEPLIQEEHLGNLYYFCDHCLRFNLMIMMISTVVFFSDTYWAIALFKGRILPSVNESLREEPIDIDVMVLDSDVLDRLAKDL